MTNNTIGYVPNPSCTRGTSEIIWSCLTAIVACVWTVLHVNVAPKSPTRNKIEHCVQCILGPEAYAAHAIKRLAECIKLRRLLRNDSGWDKWTLKQSFIVRMNGVLLRRKPDTELGDFAENNTPLCRPPEGQRSKLDKLRPATLVSFSDRGLQFHHFPKDIEIDKRSKTDWFGKTIAISQVMWFAANIITRLIRRHYVSVIEDITAAFVICGIIMYFCQLKCPQDVQEPWILDVTMTDDEWDTMLTRNTQDADDCLCNWSGSFYVAVIILIVFIGVHLAAWNYPFPSLVESWLWRSACLTLSSGIVYFHVLYYQEWNHASERSKFIADWIIRPIYCLARVTLAILAFASLRKAPSGIYDS